MKDAWKANEKMSRLGIELATEICESSSTIDDVRTLLARAVQIAEMHLRLQVNSPRFISRAVEHHRAIASQRVEDGNATLVEQLDQLGIDHRPIFRDEGLK